MFSSGIPELPMLESILPSKMNTYYSAFILPFTSASIPTPFQLMHSKTIKEPPPNFTFSWAFLSCRGSPLVVHTSIHPFDPILLCFVLFDQITLVQSSTVQFLYSGSKNRLDVWMFFTKVNNPTHLLTWALTCECMKESPYHRLSMGPRVKRTEMGLHRVEWSRSFE
jgi:hypothetical protein